MSGSFSQLKAETAGLSVKLMPLLLRREIQIVELRIERWSLRIVRKEEAKTKDEAKAGKAPKTEPAPEKAPAAKEASLPDLEVSKLRLTEGTIEYPILARITRASRT